MKQKVALVLGSGGARGIAHIGVIKELEVMGFEISSIAGTSMGALIAGVYASGKIDEYEAWIKQLNKREVLHLTDFTLNKSGLVKANRVINAIQEFIPDTDIADLPIPYTAIASDIKHKQERVISQGSLFEAIRASIAIPLVFTPLKKDDALLVDGGVYNPVPTNRVTRTANDIMIAVNVNSPVPLTKSEQEPLHERNVVKRILDSMPKFPERTKEETMGYFQLANTSTSAMISQISKLTMQIAPPDYLIEISRDSASTYDFHKANELIELGQQSTKDYFNNNYKDQIPT